MLPRNKSAILGDRDGAKGGLWSLSAKQTLWPSVSLWLPFSRQFHHRGTEATQSFTEKFVFSTGSLQPGVKETSTSYKFARIKSVISCRKCLSSTGSVTPWRDFG